MRRKAQRQGLIEDKKNSKAVTSLSEEDEHFSTWVYRMLENKVYLHTLKKEVSVLKFFGIPIAASTILVIVSCVVTMVYADRVHHHALNIANNTRDEFGRKFCPYQDPIYAQCKAIF